MSIDATTQDKRDELWQLATAANDASFRVQVAFVKLYGIMKLDPVPDAIYAELTEATQHLHLATYQLEMAVTMFRAG